MDVLTQTQNCKRKTCLAHDETVRKWDWSGLSLKVTNRNCARLYLFHFELGIKQNKNVLKHVTMRMFWIAPRVLWRDAVEEKQRERTVSEEEVCADRERIHAVLLQQGRCEFPAALTQYNCTVRQKREKNWPVTMHHVGKAWWCFVRNANQSHNIQILGVIFKSPMCNI